MKIVNFISTFFANNHLLKLDINTDFIESILIVAIVYFYMLFLYGVSIRKFSILYTLLQLIYITLNVTVILFFCGLLSFLLGNAGVIIFCVLYLIFLCAGWVKLMSSDGAYVFNAGKIPEWICNNYESKRKFYTKLNNDYKKFKQYNEDLI